MFKKAIIQTDVNNKQEVIDYEILQLAYTDSFEQLASYYNKQQLEKISVLKTKIQRLEEKYNTNQSHIKNISPNTKKESSNLLVQLNLLTNKYVTRRKVSGG